MEHIIYSSTTDLADAIRQKEVSSEEVVSAHLDRIVAVNPALNAVVQVSGEQALEQARAADAALATGDVWGPLHGVPMTIKDNLDTAGVISTGGTQGRGHSGPGRVRSGTGCHRRCQTSRCRFDSGREDQHARTHPGLRDRQRRVRPHEQSI